VVNHQEILVGGYFMGGPCDSATSKQVVVSPWSGSVVGTAAEATWSHCDSALDGAAKAFEIWRREPAERRAADLLTISTRLELESQSFAELMADEIGKPVALGLVEVQRAAYVYRKAAEFCSRTNWSEVRIEDDERALEYRTMIQREPHGVVLAITPYNWPINLAAHKIAPALAAGNTLVIKGSQQASLTTLRLARLLHECIGIPGVINAVNCEPADAERVVVDPRVNMISFTGSDAVGWRIKQLAYKIPVTLELGGNSFVFIDDSANLDTAISEIVKSGYGYAGQVCISAQNVLIRHHVFEEVCERFTSTVSRLSVQNPRDPEALCGPMISEAAAFKVENLIRETAGTVIAGGTHVGNRFEPTLIKSPDLTDRIVTEEVFGPILNLIKVDSIAQAFEIMNASKYAIHASHYTNYPHEEIVEKMNTPGLIVNGPPSFRLDALPYGGNRESGFGREGVEIAFEEMSKPKVLYVRKDPYF
jgi:acyl-CoA reductase-like NAD-dependent aldehyde dehydrogenase